ncbi:MAG: hypothetical protein WCW44_04005 [archaeon]
MDILKTKICKKELTSPFMLGSGTLGEKKEILIKALNYGAGAVVNRSLRVTPSNRKVFNPAYYIEEKYMLNADNQNITPWTYWVENAKEIEKTGPLVISMSARNPQDCKTIVEAFEKKHSPSFYELNFSCSHSAKLYGRISYEQVETALTFIKEQSKTPVFLKLSLDSLDIENLKSLEEKKLLDAYVLSNTIGPGLKIDLKTRQPVLESTYGGLSGAAIKPLVLAAINELKQTVTKPVIGVGGIESAEDALEYLIVGCDALQVYTKAHREGIHVFQTLNTDLKILLEDMHETVESIKGSIKRR